MDGTVVTEIILIFLLLCLNGLFAMSEIAVVSARRARLEQLAGEEAPGARTALELANTPERFLSTVQIGITLVGILAGAFGGATIAQTLDEALEPLPLVGPYSEVVSFALVVLAITYFSLVIGELVPKRIALGQPERIALRVAPFMQRLARVAHPAVALLSGSTSLVLRLLGVRAPDEPPLSEEELVLLLEQGTRAGVFVEEEQAIMARALELDDLRVSLIMTPRHEITWLDLENSPEEIRETLLNAPHSRLLVRRGPHNLLGMVTVQELLQAQIASGRWEIESFIRQPLMAPETMRALRLLELFRSTRVHLAVIFDEFGSIQGLVTLTDVLEVLVGHLPEPWNEEESPVIRRDDGSFLLDGLLSIRHLKTVLRIEELPGEEKYDTLGGFVVTQLGRIPESSDTFIWEGLRFEVVDMDGRRVDKVLVTPHQ